jgi:formylglycine-generating enzyme required for sulfatase activity
MRRRAILITFIVALAAIFPGRAAVGAETRPNTDPPPTLTLDLGKDVKMEFVYIRPGKFTMGSDIEPETDWQGVEKPKHEVTITKGFYLGKYEVTQAQYEAVMGSNPSQFYGLKRPVESVSGRTVAEFCRKASEKTRRDVRLPTEAEWEFACRAGTTTERNYGTDLAKLGEYAWYRENSGWETHPVGQKKPNPWGLYDMYGNVWEWVADWYGADYYSSSPSKDPTGPAKGGRRVLRGGAWRYVKHYCRSAARNHKHQDHSNFDKGFRAAVSLAPSEVDSR